MRPTVKKVSSVQESIPNIWVQTEKLRSKKYLVRRSRYDHVFEVVRGKNVLDIGCCGSHILEQDLNHHPHTIIAERSSGCLGLDIYENGIKYMRDFGLNVLKGDAEDFELTDKSFEVIVLGDIIEHVNNPGRVFECCYEHLKEDGILVLNTPNVFNISNFFSMFRRGAYQANADHVYWFDPGLLSLLLSRHNFDVQEVSYSQFDPNFLKRWMQMLRPELMGSFTLVARKI